MNERVTKSSGLRRLGRLILVGVIAVAACSEHQDLMSPEDNDGPVVEVEIRNFEFSTPELHVAPGTTVRWRNTTSNYHTVTPDRHGYWTEWQTAGVGELFEVTFTQPGTYPYYCNPHRSLGMMGTVIVE